ncbi:MAG: hypothetical protein KA085_04280 [Phenylobacterium sp.]|jgi:hypothetical protein|uniref:hypothetical protein n=1 Tax=Phenylobacterium sp. TaxID=1871053 RepID=UPI001B75CB74|nr:hypothetical protein [Phenylobacterium sp.]MBP7650773.1 hypothetical protein [Phenylobacterium sp.]MBP7815317.1 hypothetical protein [Phenylobacterium sp.]MBP9754331.1 hypothetical protein [Phenylobacterium sp.]
MRTRVGQSTAAGALCLAAFLLAMLIAAPAPAAEPHKMWPNSLSPEELSLRLEEGARRPLGSRENPIRVFRPDGERDYLSRLRCSDGVAPAFSRIGSYGPKPGIYGHIVDAYQVVCRSGDPAEATLLMDMYFADHTETAAPLGFTLQAP